LAKKLGAHHTIDPRKKTGRPKFGTIPRSAAVNLVIEHVGAKYCGNVLPAWRAGHDCHCGATAGATVSLNLCLFCEATKTYRKLRSQTARYDSHPRMGGGGKIKPVIAGCSVGGKRAKPFALLRARRVMGKILVKTDEAGNFPT